MHDVSEATLSGLSVYETRWHQARFFLERYSEAQGPPVDSYFRLTCYMDAFLFAIVSLLELDLQRAQGLPDDHILRLLKDLRNVATHKQSIAAPASAGVSRPFSRHVTMGTTPGFDSSRLFLNKDLLAQQLAARPQTNPEGQRTNAWYAGQALSRLVDEGQSLDMEQLMSDSLAALAP